MIKQFRDNMDFMLDLVRKILNLKPKDKLVFQTLNVTFDEEKQVNLNELKSKFEVDLTISFSSPFSKQL